MNNKLLVIGAGSMGSALVNRWLDSGYDKDMLIVYDHHIEQKKYYARWFKHGIKCINNLSKDETVEAVVIAVKPQQSESIIEQIKSKLARDVLVISIMAGKTVSYISKKGISGSIIRVMPNLALEYGCSVTAAYADKNVPISFKDRVKKLFTCCGSFYWCETEEKLNLFTVIGGSGPGFLFKFVQALALAGEKMGLDPLLSEDIVRQTFLGAAQMSFQKKQNTLSDLFSSIASKKGVTQAGADEFDKNDQLKDLVNSAVKAALKRNELI